MRKFLSRFSIALTIFFMLAFAAFAQQATTDDTKTFLWKVQSKTSTVYLLGSIHVAKENLYPLNPKIENAFAQSENLVVEANVLDANPLETQKLVMENACYPDKDVLAKHISPKSFAMIRTELRKYGVNISNDCKFKPWYLAMLLEMLELKQIGYNGSDGIDMHFLKSAKDKKKVLELESVEWQIKLFSDFDDKLQESYLLSTIKEYKNMGSGIDGLFDAWKIGDTKPIEKIELEGLNNDPDQLAFHKIMITDRNIKMAAKIEGYLKNKETYFVVVGAGHIVGDEGLVSLLAKKGYKVEQI